MGWVHLLNLPLSLNTWEFRVPSAKEVLDLTTERVLYISWGYFEQFMELWNRAWHDSKPLVLKTRISTSGVPLCLEFLQSES
jgi:hypothetical protein